MSLVLELRGVSIVSVRFCSFRCRCSDEVAGSLSRLVFQLMLHGLPGWVALSLCFRCRCFRCKPVDASANVSVLQPVSRCFSNCLGASGTVSKLQQLSQCCSSCLDASAALSMLQQMSRCFSKYLDASANVSMQMSRCSGPVAAPGFDAPVRLRLWVSMLRSSVRSAAVSALDLVDQVRVSLQHRTSCVELCVQLSIRCGLACSTSNCVWRSIGCGLACSSCVWRVSG